MGKVASDHKNKKKAPNFLRKELGACVTKVMNYCFSESIT